MKFVRFEDPAGTVMWGQEISADSALPVVGNLFGAWALADEPVSIERRLAPADPPNVFAIGLNYADHAREAGGRRLPAEPLIFIKASTSVTGPGDSIVLPRSAPDEVDYEAELAIVIGKKARHVAKEQAMDHVFGFTCANDVSARDCQIRRDKQWARAKSFDTFCPLGPVLVTTDALDCGRLEIRSILNGRVMQQGTTADMVFPVAELVSYLSDQFTLLPGTVILSGTPAGVGFARKPPVYLRPDDRIEVEIEGIGCLSNRVVGPG
ncbi:MAG: fumarylacetoacetate hydrolase family protein [Planctomycetota bacterium]|nr:fumarylacetoacetate hydrolase family protein [Planctomycetota bacterium]